MSKKNIFNKDDDFKCRPSVNNYGQGTKSMQNINSSSCQSNSCCSNKGPTGPIEQ